MPPGADPVRSLLISSTYFPPQVGGISEMMAAVAEHLGSTRVCCLTGVAGPAAARPRGIAVYRRPRAFRGGRAVRAASLLAAVAEILIRERPDVLQLATAQEGYIGRRLKRSIGLPYVIWAHGNEILDAARPGSRRSREALIEADRVFANSRFTAGLLGEIGVRPDRTEVLHPGCDLEVFGPRAADPVLRRRVLGSRAGGPVIISVGNLVERKGHDQVIRALPGIAEAVPGVAYLIVGDGIHRPALESLVDAIGVRDRVIFTGRADRGALPGLIGLADVFAMPSRARIDQCDVEGFGLVFLEAAACGKPVVGGRSGGIPDALIDGQTGILVNPEDRAELAAALTRILTDPALAASLGARGRDWVSANFGWPTVVARLDRSLRSVCRRPLEPA